MENDNKYYTPTIEEFYVGFEYEKYDDRLATYRENNYKPTNWHKFKYDLKSIRLSQLESHLYEKTVRVKYLDKEDIESLGWKHTFHSIDEWFEIEGSFDMGSWISYKATMHYGLKDHRLYIQMWDTGVEGPNVFQGTINNKSELKKLMQQLGIYGK